MPPLPMPTTGASDNALAVALTLPLVGLVLAGIF
jgi:hypothetical protein